MISEEERMRLRNVDPFLRRHKGEDTFVTLVTDIVWEDECTQRFAKVCEEMKAAGYKEIWVGDCPLPNAWFKDWNRTNQFFAVPALYRSSASHGFGFRARAYDIFGKYFPTACGNGREEFEQVQIEIQLPESFRGRHIL